MSNDAVFYDILYCLDQLREPLQTRRNLLNKIAQGEVTPTTEEYSNIQYLSGAIRQQVEALAEEFLRAPKRVVMGGDTNGDGLDALTALPARLQAAYALVASAAFGWGSSTDDPAALGKADGKAVRWRTSSGTTHTHGSVKSPKKFGAGKRVVKNERAFDKKASIDKKLRRVAIELEQFLEMGRSENMIENVCSGTCKRLGDVTWNYCSNCGGRMERYTREPA